MTGCFPIFRWTGDCLKWLKAGYMERGVFNHTNSGTPQGGIISPVLANMALDGLEKELMQTFRKVVITVQSTR